MRIHLEAPHHARNRDRARGLGNTNSRRRLRVSHRLLAWLGAVGAGLALLSCGAEEAPLGGPYGGRASLIGPTDGGYNVWDATITPPRPPTTGNGSGAGESGTWTGIFNRYLAKDTPGNCPTCHAEMSSPPASFEWLQEDGYVGAADPLLTSQGASCLTWYGGDMPPGTSVANADAVRELTQWAAAGARNN
jgi:hypothetical protein